MSEVSLYGGGHEPDAMAMTAHVDRCLSPFASWIGGSGSGCGVLGPRFRAWGLGFEIFGLGFGCWVLEFGVWGLGFGV